MSVFSEHLHTVCRLILQAKTRKKMAKNPLTLKDTIIFLKERNIIYPDVLLRLSEDESSYSYILCTNPRINYVIKWISKNIIDESTKDNFETVRIKLRIANSMLAKLYLQEDITQEQFLYFTDNLNRNVLDLQSPLNSEELPF